MYITGKLPYFLTFFFFSPYCLPWGDGIGCHDLSFLKVEFLYVDEFSQSESTRAASTHIQTQSFTSSPEIPLGPSSSDPHPRSYHYSGI